MNMIKIIRDGLQAKGAVLLIGGPGTGKYETIKNFLDSENIPNSRLLYIITNRSLEYAALVEEEMLEENATVREGILKKFIKLAYNELLSFAGIKKTWDTQLPQLTPKEIDWIRAALKGNFPRFYVVIEEFLQSDPANTFGELLSLFPMNRRLFQSNENIVHLMGSGERFGIPPNIFIIATSTIWREPEPELFPLFSLFRVIHMHTPMEVLRQYIDNKKLADALVSAMNKINHALEGKTEIGPWLFIREIHQTPPEKQCRVIKEVFAEQLCPMLLAISRNAMKLLTHYFKNDEWHIPLQQKILAMENEEFISFLEQLDSEKEDYRASYQY